MSVPQYRSLALSMAFVAILTGAAIALLPQQRKPPKTIDEALFIAGERGFHIIANAISREPMTLDEVNLLHADQWQGMARVVAADFEDISARDGMAVMRWGKVVVYGDPDVVRELVAR